jgi:uncharacterized MAPEG superfamily protein
MSLELTLLGWTFVLAIVQVMWAGAVRTGETGRAYNVGPRDEPGPPVGILAGRLKRAEANLFETLPLFTGAILIAHVAGREGALTHWGAWLYLIGRSVYVPLYATGVPGVRTAVWSVAFLGLLLVLVAILGPA